MLEPFDVYDLVLEEAEIEWGTKRLRSNRSRVPSEIWVEHLQ